MAKKEIDKDRFYFVNNEDGTTTKVYSHYTDKTPIVLTPEQEKIAKEAIRLAGLRAAKLIEENPAARKKPAYKRKGLREDPDKKKKEEIKT